MSEELKPEMTNDSVKLFLEYMIGVREFFNELEGDPKVILAKSLPALFEHLAEALELMPSDETLRASLAPVDIEGLVTNVTDAICALPHEKFMDIGIGAPFIRWVIDHLAARGFFGVSEWQPIETAPKDGVQVLVCASDWKYPTIAYYSPKRNNWCKVLGTTRLPQPTHWMPLPAAPKKEGE